MILDDYKSKALENYNWKLWERNRVILPIMRRVFPTVLAADIIGVQPMTGPTSLIQTMRVRYKTMRARFK